MGTESMNVLEFSVVTCLVSFGAGFLGSLTGLGGGVVIVPVLSLAFGVDIRYAIGASLISVIATSSGAASAYVKEGFSNVRIGMFLEVATTFGALAGAADSGSTPTPQAVRPIGAAHPDADELVEAFEATWDEIDAMVRAGQVTHALTLTALLYARYLKG